MTVRRLGWLKVISISVSIDGYLLSHGLYTSTRIIIDRHPFSEGKKKKEGRKRHKPKPISLGFLFFFFFRCKYILVSIRRCFQDPSLRCHFRLLAMDAKHGQSQLSVQGRAESQLWLPETRTAEAVRILQGSARKAERRREILKNYCLQFCKGGFLKI